MNNNIIHRVLGVMSGTSIDGLDIVLCNFIKDEKWKFEIEDAITFKYSKFWKDTLRELPYKKIKEIKEIDIIYGQFIGEKINLFLGNRTVDFISCHGHTIFHQPEKKITLQIGNGREIVKKTNIKTINNFRSLDVSLGGQGAPLVPIGDLYLFPNYKFCVNIGGFANISIKNKSKITAYDICPANIALNKISEKIGFNYDNNGNMAKRGKLNSDLLHKLNNVKFYKINGPKSLGKEWFEQEITEILNNYKNEYDILNTLCEHIALQISLHTKKYETLVTGGGALNRYLVNRIKFHSSSKIIIPNKKIIEFKEALIFAFLGVLKTRNEINCLKSVTGASRNSSTGDIHLN